MGQDLWILPLFGDRKPFPFVQTPFNDTTPQFSPDGRWMVYASNESKRFEVYVKPFPGPGGRVQVSTTGGIFPRWRRDGKEIFFRSADNKLMAAAVSGQGSSFEVGDVRPLFPVRVGGPFWFYDVSADGKRFLVNTAEEQPATSLPLTLVVNWTDLLKK